MPFEWLIVDCKSEFAQIENSEYCGCSGVSFHERVYLPQSGNKFADMFKGARTSQKAEELPNTYEIDGTVSTEKKPFAQLGLQTCYSCKKGIFT